ncbi:hypothetical protein [Methanomethylovorans sp.]|uniref:hypothetical protein n=1 Tax=Methanomethylovorans sp. TaxID=2758717 RepID=UPI00345E6082
MGKREDERLPERMHRFCAYMQRVHKYAGFMCTPWFECTGIVHTGPRMHNELI